MRLRICLAVLLLAWPLAAIAATPSESVAAKVVTLRYSGGMGSDTWEITVRDDGAVELTGNHVALNGRLDRNRLRSIGSILQELDASGLPEHIGADRTDAPELTVIDFRGGTQPRSHILEISSGGPAAMTRDAKRFSRLWKRLVATIELPGYSLPYGPTVRVGVR